MPPPVRVPAGDSLTHMKKAADGRSLTFAFNRLGPAGADAVDLAVGR